MNFTPMSVASINSVLVRVPNQPINNCSTMTASPEASTSSVPQTAPRQSSRPLQATMINSPKEVRPSSAVHDEPPPPYSDAIASQPTSQHAHEVMQPHPTSSSTMPPLLLELLMGRRLAKRAMQKRADKLEATHEAWAQLGVNIRHGELPPHFWNPPRCTPAEMDQQLRKMGL